MITQKDRIFLKRSIELAEEALKQGHAPFGSILVSADGEILFEDYNRNGKGDETRHPEFEITRWSVNYLTPKERSTTTVYTSSEHCSMCASAHGLVGLGRIVYASSGKQLKEWKEEFGIESGPLRGLSIEEVLKDSQVDGPDSKLSEIVKALQKKYHDT